MQRGLLAAVVLVAALAVGCDTEPVFDTVDDLYAAAGGEEWCGDELTVTLAPYVGNCGDPTTDSRVVLGVGGGGDELRSSIDAARDNLVDDGQLLLVPSNPDRTSAWQLRTRDRGLLEQAQEELGGVILDSPDDIDEWLNPAS